MKPKSVTKGCLLDVGHLWDQGNFATKWVKITFTALIHKAEIYAKLSRRKD